MPKAPSRSDSPFDWLDSRPSRERAKIEQGRREAMYRTELEERAGLLHRLGHGRDWARTRLLANLDWDFAPGPSPIGAAAVDAILDRVFGQAAPGKPSARGKGGTR
jgi:hypothetical protein